MTSSDRYLNYPIDSADRQILFARMRRVLTTLLGDGRKRFGNEGHSICNSAYPDAFDILYEDAPESALNHYELLVDLSGSLAHRHPHLAGRILTAEDESALYCELNLHLTRLLPCRVKGNLSWIVNRTNDGWVLELFNNEGVLRTRADGDTILHEADTLALIETEDVCCAVLIGKSDSLSRGDDGIWRYQLPAGQPAILKFQPKS